MKTLEEQKNEFKKIEQNYWNLAGQVGHKAKLVDNTHKLVEKTQDEIEAHMKEMDTLRIQLEGLQVAINQQEITDAPTTPEVA